MFKRLLSAGAALVLTSTLALAVISGIKSDSQDQQVSMGQMQLGSGTATGNSVTINNGSGVITTASLTTAQNLVTAITLTNNRIAVGDQVQCTVDPLSSAGNPFCANAKVTAGQVVFNVSNNSASALNGPVAIYFWVNKSGNPN